MGEMRNSEIPYLSLEPAVEASILRDRQAGALSPSAFDDDAVTRREDLPHDRATLARPAFVRDIDLFVVDLSAPATDGTFVERQITHDGVRGSIINGIPDWVYEVETRFARA